MGLETKDEWVLAKWCLKTKERPLAQYRGNPVPRMAGRNYRNVSVAGRWAMAGEHPRLVGRGQCLGVTPLSPRGATHSFARFFPEVVS